MACFLEGMSGCQQHLASVIEPICYLLAFPEGVQDSKLSPARILNHNKLLLKQRSVVYVIESVRGANELFMTLWRIDIGRSILGALNQEINLNTTRSNYLEVFMGLFDVLTSKTAA